MGPQAGYAWGSNGGLRLAAGVWAGGRGAVFVNTIAGQNTEWETNLLATIFVVWCPGHGHSFLPRSQTVWGK